MKRILMLGRLTPRKRLETALRAVATLKHNFGVINIKLMLAGPFEEKYHSYLNVLAKRLRIEQDVVFIGPISEEMKWKLIASSDLMLHTSEFETFCRTALEAWLFKKPIICFDLGPATKFITEVKGGLTVPLGNQEQLARAIHKIINDKGLAEKMGKRGHRAVDRHYNWEVISSAYIKVYKMLLDSRKDKSG